MAVEENIQSTTSFRGAIASAFHLPPKAAHTANNHQNDRSVYISPSWCCLLRPLSRSSAERFSTFATPSTSSASIIISRFSLVHITALIYTSVTSLLLFWWSIYYPKQGITFLLATVVYFHSFISPLSCLSHSFHWRRHKLWKDDMPQDDWISRNDFANAKSVPIQN